MSRNQANNAGDNSAQPHEVFSNDDLLTEILIHLPILRLYLFTSVSQKWRKILTSPDFTRNRRQIHNLDPPAGLFVRYNTYTFKCHFVSLDSRLQSRKVTAENSFGLASAEVLENIKLVQSCNGLLLYTGPRWYSCYYVYNSSTNMFKKLRPPSSLHAADLRYFCFGVRMAFDPTKSYNYKTIFTGETTSHGCDIQIYCSETRKWSLCRDRFPSFSFCQFNNAINLNGDLNWLHSDYISDGYLEDGYLKHCKLNIEDHEHPILTTIQIHQGLRRGRYFFEPLDNNFPSHITLQLGVRFYSEGKLFESRGCLLAVHRHHYGSREFTIYEMRKECSVWLVRYLVNTDDFINPLPEGWSIWSTVWSIVLGEREEDSCLVINLSGKVVKYILISKTLHEIYDTGSNQLDNGHVLPIKDDHIVYEFSPSFASV